MSKQISSLSVALFATVAPFANGLKAGERAITGLVGKVGEIGGKLIEMTGIAAIAGTALGSVFELGKGFSLAAQLETAAVQLKALTGSGNNAAIMLGQLRDFARENDFAFPELLEATKKLLSVGVAAKDIDPMLHQIGDAAKGSGSDINSIADIFVKVAAEGKVSSRELKEFGNQGIPVVAALAKQFNTTAAGVAELADNGTIGFNQLRGAFASLSGPGGQFNGILAAQANTIGGVMHTLSATVEDASADIAEHLLKAFNVGGWIPKITSAMGGVGNAISQGIDVAAPYIINFGKQAVGVFEDIYNWAMPPLTQTWGVVKSVWGGIAELVSTYGSTIVAAAVGVWNQVLDFARPIWQAVYTVVSDNWQSIYAHTVAINVAVWDLISTTWNAVVDIAYRIWGGITGAWAAGWTAIMGSSAAGKNDTETTFGSIVTIFGWMQDAVTIGLGVISYSISHFGDLVRLIGIGVILDLVTMGNQIEWVFTTVIPTAAKFAWGVIKDFGRFTATEFGNLATNIGSVFGNLKGLITGAVKFDDIWKPLTDGFQYAAEQWPGIAERQAGPLEASLTSQYQSLSDQFGQGIADHLAQNAKKAADIVKTTTKGIQAAVTDAVTTDWADIDEPKPITFDASVNPTNLTVGITPEIKRAQAIRSGSAESLAARFNNPVYQSGSGASGPLSGGGLPQAQQPRTPAVASASDASTKAQADQLLIANQWLYRIELNTRGSTGTGTTVVRI